MDRKPSTFMSQGDYVKDGGNHCPACASENISAGETNYSGSIIWQEVGCLDCGAKWNDQYELKNYEILDYSTSREPA
jgi:hypothetical protein